MRRSMRSNVMRRRLFNNGGMGMTKPAASGILASSQPLVDVLAGQARDNLTNGINVGNQMYGLNVGNQMPGSNGINVGNQMPGSNVQGTNLMNQGGIANYAGGGVEARKRARDNLGVKIVPTGDGKVIVPVAGSQDMNKNAEEIVTEEVVTDDESLRTNQGAGMFEGLTPNDIAGRSDAEGSVFSRQLRKGSGAVQDAWRIHIERGGNPTEPVILPDGTIIVGNADGTNGQIYVEGRTSGQGIYEESRLVPGLTKENIGLVGNKNMAEITTLPGDIVGDVGAPDETISETIESEKISPDQIAANIAEINAKNIKSEADLRDMTKQDSNDSNVVIKEIFGDEVVTPEGKKVVEKKKVTPEGKEITKKSEEVVNDPGDTDQVTDDISLTSDSEAVLMDSINNIQINAKDEKTTAEKMAVFKEEFKNAMPEYQGMSDEEKGNAWIKMGMAVAAGQSGNAITNIANGVLATIDEFADDPKQKREYEMKVALAGSKYALERLGADRVKLEGIEAENRTILDYVTSTPFTFNGKEYAKGDPFQITRSQFNDGILNKLPKGAVVQPPIFKDMEDTLQSFNAFQATLSSSGAKMGDWIKERDLYGSVIKDMKSGINMRLYLGEASELLNNGEVAGAQGLLLSGFDQALNFLGFDQGELSILRSKNKQLYNQKMKEVGTQMLTQILGETNRTISDNDRKLVNELTALIGDYRATGQNIDVINEKILSIDRKIQDDLQANSIKLQGIESTWGEGVKVKDSGVIPSDILRKNREAQFPSQRGRATTDGTQKIFKYEDIWDTENNVFKTGIDWGSN